MLKNRISLSGVRWFARGLAPCLSLSACAGELDGDPSAYQVSSAESAGCDRAPQIFAAVCVGCHGSAEPQGGLDLASPGVEARLLDHPSSAPACTARRLVDSSAPSQSFLIEKLDSSAPLCGAPMPLAGTLADDDRECLKQWALALARTGTASATTQGGGPLGEAQ